MTKISTGQSTPIESITKESIKKCLQGDDVRNERAAEALMDVYENAQDGQRVVDLFLGSGKNLRSQVIDATYQGVKKDPNQMKEYLMKKDFAVFQRYHDG